MSKNGEILAKFVDEDFGAKFSGNYAKGVLHDSLVVDIEKGIFFYNSQDIVGDPLTYLTRVRGMSFNDAKDYLRSFDYVGTVTYTVRGKSNNDDIIVYPALVDIFFELGRNKDNRQYLYSRNINDYTIDRFKIGWYNGWVTIPFYVDGSFRNFQMRRDNPKQMKSYYKGVGGLLFNSDILKLTDTVFLTEGPVDALALLQNGIPAISTNIGGGFLPEWYGYFTGQKQIYIVFDNDEAGNNEAVKVAKVLGEDRCKIYTFWNFGDEKGYDPVDYFRYGREKEDFLELVTRNAKYCYELESRKINLERRKKWLKG